jgi:hypothetical protein
VLAVGPGDGVFVGGRTNSDSGGMDYLALKYGVASAVEETMNDAPSGGGLRGQRGTLNVEPTIVRGVLFMEARGEKRVA